MTADRVLPTRMPAPRSDQEGLLTRHDAHLTRSTHERARQSAPLTIRVSTGTGTALTRLAAFDAALRAAGVADFNLVRLSSVIPPATPVLEVPAGDQIQGDQGDLLYCIYADAYASTPGEEAWAGLAWGYQDDHGGPGLFVEHHGSSEIGLTHDLSASLRSVAEGRSWSMARQHTAVASVVCTGHPVCAVVIATYRRAGWDPRGF